MTCFGITISLKICLKQQMYYLHPTTSRNLQKLQFLTKVTNVSNDFFMSITLTVQRLQHHIELFSLYSINIISKGFLATNFFKETYATFGYILHSSNFIKHVLFVNF